MRISRTFGQPTHTGAPRPFVAASEDLVQLSEEEEADVIAEAIADAKKEKYRAQTNALYYWRINNPPPITARGLAKYYLKKAREEDPKFSLSHGNLRRVFKQLCFYFSQDQRFTGDPNKGLLLMGSVGRGKTTLLKLFLNNPYKPYGILPALKVCRMYQGKGVEGVAHLQGVLKNGIAFDDLGTEPPLSNWMGNQTNVLGDILLARYDLLQDGLIEGNETHATTNLPVRPPKWKADEAGLPGPEFVGRKKLDFEGQELPSLQFYYGNRVTDRFKEMFNQIVVEGAKSLRK